jgi:hypothetical protein
VTFASGIRSNASESSALGTAFRRPSSRSPAYTFDAGGPSLQSRRGDGAATGGALLTAAEVLAATATMNVVVFLNSLAR